MSRGENMVPNLRHQVEEVTVKALESGALQPIATRLAWLKDGNLAFCIRILHNLVRKDAEKKAKRSTDLNKPHNPFLPYEEALFVGNLSDTHACLLNKYNVVEHHILIVTRAYESQRDWLNEADFAALAACMVQMNGLGFFNGGTQAGASQHHKHLQIVPFAAEEGRGGVPMADAVDADKAAVEKSGCLPSLPFDHAVRLLDLAWTEDDSAGLGQELFAVYQQLIAAIGLNIEASEPDVPYNLLITREWMMAVPRSQDRHEGIGVNSLGYAGWLLVKTAEDLERLKQIGPINLLQTVGIAKRDPK